MKKKLFAIASGLVLAASTLSTTAFASESTSSTDSSSNSNPYSWIIMIGIYAVVILGAYFLLFRPQSKKKKKEAALRRNAQIGDEVTTIGGIHGRIIAVKEETDSLVLETGTDRNKINIKRWAISSVDSGEAVAAQQPAKSGFGFFGKKKNTEENK